MADHQFLFNVKELCSSSHSHVNVLDAIMISYLTSEALPLCLSEPLFLFSGLAKCCDQQAVGQ